MAKTDYKTIDAYHETFSGEVLKRMQVIRKLIRKIAPEAEEVISYQVPAFKIGKKFLIYYAAYPKHISVSYPWSDALRTEFAEDLKNYKVSKSAIQLPLDKPLPEEFLEKLLQYRKQEVG